MNKPKTFKAPFLRGELLQYASEWDQRQPEFEWHEVIPFRETMTIESMYSGRSAKGVCWKSSGGKEYPMFVKDLLDMLRIATVREGTVSGNWQVCKRGANYGIQYIGDSAK